MNRDAKDFFEGEFEDLSSKLYTYKCGERSNVKLKG